ncbi:hypothetical protein M3Y99_01511200 [Aphelenchoides fujianensis]|nr:hypothetical protein M3Y99_01511200 [Aphelenchoides fujianensis]
MTVSSRCPVPGIIIEILNLISKVTGIKIVPMTHASMGLPPGLIPLAHNEEWLQNGTIDLMGFGLQKTARRERLFEFSEWIYEAETMLVTRKREETLGSIWSFFFTYDRAVWLLIVGAVALQWIVCVFSRFVQRVKLRAGDCAFGCVRLLLLQPTSGVIGGTTAEHVSLCILRVLLLHDPARRL